MISRAFAGGIRRWVLIPVVFAVVTCSLLAQTQAEAAIGFFRAGGAYCFRIAPPGVSLGEENEWTVMLLTSSGNHKTRFKIREVDAGATELRGSTLKKAGQVVTGVWRMDSERTDFFDRFAAGIRAGLLRARVVHVRPPALDRARNDRERAELYLEFADRGSTVAFDKAPDLNATDFGQYVDYMPD